MSFGEVFLRDRQVIPRWHTYPVAKWLGVIATLNFEDEKKVLDEDYTERILSYQEKGKITHASDLVGNALVLNNFNDSVAIDAANFILNNHAISTKLLMELAHSYLQMSKIEPFPTPENILPEETQKFHDLIANLKMRIREYPRNPILWMDLAFYYSSMGQSFPANEAVKVALSLNKENRYLLRSGARFFVHSGTPDVALSFLRKSTMARYDPWLLAAEIAISDTIDSPSKVIKVAKEMLTSESIPKFHLSELASALGTIEYKAGSRKIGKKLFNVALEEPTENSVAQAVFLNSVFGKPSILISPENLTDSFEAQTRVNFQKREFSGSLEAAKKWFAYQPFSARPAVAGSYIASVALGQYEEAIKIAKLGLSASPQNTMLRNNLVFSLASLGRITEAKKALASIVESQIPEYERTVIAATRGVVEFRQGNIEEGRRLYKSAIEEFRKRKDMRAEIIAKYFLSREEAILKTPNSNKLLEEAKDLAEKHKIFELLGKQ